MASTTFMHTLRALYGFSLDHVATQTKINNTILSRLERGLLNGTDDQRATLQLFYGAPWERLTSEAVVDSDALRSLLGGVA